MTFSPNPDPPLELYCWVFDAYLFSVPIVTRKSGCPSVIGFCPTLANSMGILLAPNPNIDLREDPRCGTSVQQRKPKHQSDKWRADTKWTHQKHAIIYQRDGHLQQRSENQVVRFYKGVSRHRGHQCTQIIEDVGYATHQGTSSQIAEPQPTALRYCQGVVTVVWTTAKSARSIAPLPSESKQRHVVATGSSGPDKQPIKTRRSSTPSTSPSSSQSPIGVSK